MIRRRHIVRGLEPLTKCVIWLILVCTPWRAFPYNYFFCSKSNQYPSSQEAPLRFYLLKKFYLTTRKTYSRRGCHCERCRGPGNGEVVRKDRKAWGETKTPTSQFNRNRSYTLSTGYLRPELSTSNTFRIASYRPGIAAF